MKIKILWLLVAVFVAGTIGGGLYFKKNHPSQPEAPVHEHQWGKWQEPEDPEPDSTAQAVKYVQFRSCTNCGVAEFRVVQESK